MSLGPGGPENSSPVMYTPPVSGSLSLLRYFNFHFNFKPSFEMQLQ
ncbi:hypothetical protein A2U01_0066557, partial [Trifolium medium]|nr:hypothetical protein [Trifolium medium]